MCVCVLRVTDFANWSNELFHAALKLNPANYQVTVQSWLEQRAYLTTAIDALGKDSLAEQIRLELAQLRPSLPSTAGYRRVDPNLSVCLSALFIVVCLSALLYCCVSVCAVLLLCVCLFALFIVVCLFALFHCCVSVCAVSLLCVCLRCFIVVCLSALFYCCVSVCAVHCCVSVCAVHCCVSVCAVSCCVYVCLLGWLTSVCVCLSVCVCVSVCV